MSSCEQDNFKSESKLLSLTKMSTRINKVEAKDHTKMRWNTIKANSNNETSDETKDIKLKLLNTTAKFNKANFTIWKGNLYIIENK